jgi:hypothetical protein
LTSNASTVAVVLPESLSISPAGLSVVQVSWKVQLLPFAMGLLKSQGVVPEGAKLGVAISVPSGEGNGCIMATVLKLTVPPLLLVNVNVCGEDESPSVRVKLVGPVRSA